MKNHFLHLLTLLITFTGVAQEFQGKAYYMSKTTIDPNFGKNMPPDRKKRIIDRMKSSMEKNYELTFNSTVSLFYEQEK